MDLRKTVIGDERWCFLRDPETKRQTLHWKITTFPTSPKAYMPELQIAGLLLCLSAICRMFRRGGQESIQLITCTHTYANTHTQTHTCADGPRDAQQSCTVKSPSSSSHTHAHTRTRADGPQDAQQSCSLVRPIHHTHRQAHVHTHTHTCTYVLMAHRMLTRITVESIQLITHTHTHTHAHVHTHTYMC